MDEEQIVSQEFVVWCSSHTAHRERIEAYDPDDAARKFAQIMYEHPHEYPLVNVLYRGESLVVAMADSFGHHHDRVIKMKLAPEFVITKT